MQAGERYALRLVNDSGQLHDWTIDAIPATDVRSRGYGRARAGPDGYLRTMATSTSPCRTENSETGQMMRLHVAAEKGEDRHMSFVPTEKGEYVFYCTVGNHREAGMEGRLIVE